MEVQDDRGNVILNEMKDLGRWMDPSASPQDDMLSQDDIVRHFKVE